MVHRQFGRWNPTLTVVADSRRPFALPPLGLPQFFRAVFFSLNVSSTDVRKKTAHTGH
jgi:hypothetical protein